jgi:hypothetical protein
MTERDPIEKRLMLARAASWAPRAAKARVRAKLAAGGALTPAIAARSGGVTKLTTALLVGAGFVAGYWLGVQRSAEPEHAAPAASAGLAPIPGEGAATAGSSRAVESVDEASPPGASPAPAVTASAHDAFAPPEAAAARARPQPVDRAGPARALVGRAPAASADPASEELMLLSRAERAIRATQPLLALSFLDELDARFPSSTLLEERAAARLLAECALGNPGSRRRAELFLRDRAASVYTDRVRRSCALEAALATTRAPSPTSAPSHLPPTSPAADGSLESGH